MSLGIAFTNKGRLTQENVKGGVKISGPLSSTVLSTSSVPSLATNALDSLNIADVVLNQGIGNYRYDVFTQADSLDDESINDTLTVFTEVTDNVFSWATDGNAGYRPGTLGTTYDMCSLFTLQQPDSVVAISVQFSHNDNDPNDPDNLIPMTDFLQFKVLDASQLVGGVYNGAPVAEYKIGTNSFTKCSLVISMQG